MAKAKPVTETVEPAEVSALDPRRPNPEAETTVCKPKVVTKVGETTIEDY